MITRRFIAQATALACLAFLQGVPVGAAENPGAIKVGSEVTLAADGPGGRTRDNGGAAYGGDVFLVTWHEGVAIRDGVSRVVAARISADGKLLDEKPIDLGLGNGGLQEHPRVAFCAGVFLVVWQEFNGTDMDVLGVRVAPDGKVLDTRPIAIAVGPRTQVLPDVTASDKISDSILCCNGH